MQVGVEGQVQAQSMTAELKVGAIREADLYAELQSDLAAESSAHALAAPH